MNIFRVLIRPSKIFTPLIIPLLSYRSIATFAETSRQIEQRMREERNKSLNNQFKALQSHFGLNRPSSISSSYPKPSSYEYSIESLRKNSHMFPEYLLSELNNKKSQYYQVIQSLFDSLSSTDNKQAIQFLQFMISWKVYRHNEEYQQILVRKIYQMNMDLSQLFRILKAIIHVEEKEIRNAVLVDVENKILNKVIEIEHYQYESLFRILNFMRMHDLSPKVKPEIIQNIFSKKQKITEKEEQQKIADLGGQSFFKIVETVLLRNLNDIPLPSLVEMIVHYANNIKENHDDKIQILGKVEHKVLQNLSFFTHDELIAIIYSYLKTQTQTDTLIDEFVRRVQLLYFEISWANKRKILSIASSLPYNKWLYIVGLSIHEVLKGKKIIYRDNKVQNDPNAKEVEYQLLPAIYLAAYQTNLTTPELIDKIQPKILQNIFNYSSQDIGLITWLFTITPPSMTPKRQNRDLLYTKVESIIVGGFNASTFTLKDISMVVWSLCNYGGKSNFIYKENSDFWKNIEFYIQQRITNKKQERLLNGCCQILWAYLNNKSLTIKTINMITDVIIERDSSKALVEEMFNFELIMITSFYYSLRASLPKPIMQFIQNICFKYFTLLLPEMDYLEIMKILKFILTDVHGQVQPNTISKQVWTQIIDQFHIDIGRVEYQYIMGVVGYTIISPQGRTTEAKAVEVVTKLMAKKKQLEQLKPVNSQAS